MSDQLFQIYVSKKKKDGTVVKSDKIITSATSKDQAIEKIKKQAKELYRYKGKIYIGSIYTRPKDKSTDWEKLQ